MAKVSEILKTKLTALTQEELLKIVLRFARKYKEMNEILEFELANTVSKDELLEEIQVDIETELMFVEGRIIQKNLAKAIGKCITLINNFKKIVKSPYHEALALDFLLDSIYNEHSDCFGTCFTVFDSKVATTTKRFLNLVNKLHPDYHIEFSGHIDRYLKILKKEANHLDMVYNLPQDFNSALQG